MSPTLPRDWPPDPQPPERPASKPPKKRMAIMLLTMILLVFGSPLVSWAVAALPGDQPWAAVIVPAAWFAALVVFLVGSYLNIMNGRK